MQSYLLLSLTYNNYGSDVWVLKRIRREKNRRRRWNTLASKSRIVRIKILWDECGHFRLLGGKRRKNKAWTGFLQKGAKMASAGWSWIFCCGLLTKTRTRHRLWHLEAQLRNTNICNKRLCEVLNATYVKQPPVTVLRIPEHFKLYHTFCSAILIACLWVIKISRDMVTNKRPTLCGCLSGTCFRSLHTHRE